MAIKLWYTSRGGNLDRAFVLVNTDAQFDTSWPVHVKDLYTLRDDINTALVAFGEIPADQEADVNDHK